MASKVMHFDTLAKHSPVNSKAYAAPPKEFVIRFEKKSSNFWFICNFIFSQHQYSICKFSRGMFRVPIQYLVMSLYQTSISPLLPERNTPHLSHTGSCRCFWQYAHLWAAVSKDEAQEERATFHLYRNL